MIERHRYLLAAAAAACLVLLVWMIVPRSAPPVIRESPPFETPPSPAPTHADPGGSGVDPTYALQLTELQGLPEDAAPGTRVEIWVSWDPPITKRSRVQLLIPEALVDRIIPPFTPESPPTVVLALPQKAVPDLIYGDRYGALSALVLP